MFRIRKEDSSKFLLNASQYENLSLASNVSAATRFWSSALIYLFNVEFIKCQIMLTYTTVLAAKLFLLLSILLRTPAVNAQRIEENSKSGFNLQQTHSTLSTDY